MKPFRQWSDADVAAHQLRVSAGRKLPPQVTVVSLLAEAQERERKKKTAKMILANILPPQPLTTITLPYPPSANRYWRSIVINGQVRVLVSTEARRYKETAGDIAAKAFARPLAGPVGIRLHVFRPRKAGDLGNRIKVIEDALQGYAFTDDNQIEHIEARRFEDKGNPRVEVSVWGISEKNT